MVDKPLPSSSSSSSSVTDDILMHILLLWRPERPADNARLCAFATILSHLVDPTHLVHDGRGSWQTPFADTFELPDTLMWPSGTPDTYATLATPRHLLARLVAQIGEMSSSSSSPPRTLTAREVTGLRALTVLLALFDYRVQRYVRCEHRHHAIMRTMAMTETRATVVFDSPRLVEAAVHYATDMQHPDVGVDPDRAVRLTHDFVQYATTYIMHHGIVAVVAVVSDDDDDEDKNEYVVYHQLHAQRTACPKNRRHEHRIGLCAAAVRVE